MKFVFIVLFVCTLFASYSQTQKISIEGIIKDTEGHPVTAATVKAKKTRIGSWTSDNGTFRLDGVKPGDTLFFSRVAFCEAYFVVQKNYNILNFTMVRDTVPVFFKEGTNSTYFSFRNTFTTYNSLVKPIVFYETAVPVKTVTVIDEDRIFTKVEVGPNVKCNYPQFIDTLVSDINQLSAKLKPKSNGTIKVYFWVRTNKTIEVSAVEPAIKNEVKNIFINRFQSVKSVNPAIQNGRFADVLCVAHFIFTIGKDKNITLKMVSY